MNPVAKNKTIITQEIFGEGYKQIWEKAYFKSIQKTLYLIAVVIIASFVYIYGNKLPLFYLLTELFFIACVLAYILLIIPHNFRKKAYRRLSEGCSDTPWRNYTFFSDHLLIDFPNGTTEEHFYRDITKIHHGKNIMLLYTDENHTILIDNRTFTGEMGSRSFESLLNLISAQQ